MSIHTKANAREIKGFIIDCVLAGVVPFVQSSPGLGKSAIIRGIADEFNLKLIDHRLSTSAPEDLSGLPTFLDYEHNGFAGKKATFSPFDLFPTEDVEVPKGKDGWLLFLDEFNSATKSVQAAAYKLILDRMVGQHKLHHCVAIVTAGNLTTDRAITNPLSTAMQSRVVHLEMELNHQHFLEDVVLGHGWDHRLYAFLSFKNSYIHDFRPDHNDKTFCCPRTWEFMNRLLSINSDVNMNRAKLFAGTITSGVAFEFVTFCQLYENLPKLEDIVKDPMGTSLSGDAATRFAITSSLMEKVTEKNFESITKYINRMTSEFRVMFFRGMLQKKPELRNHKLFHEAMLELSRYLHG
jgi:hypothetical protein